MAKRQKPGGLFDNLEGADARQGTEAAVRSSLLGGGAGGGIDQVALHDAAQARYLNYALSVITARAKNSRLT